MGEIFRGWRCWEEMRFRDFRAFVYLEVGSRCSLGDSFGKSWLVGGGGVKEEIMGFWK